MKIKLDENLPESLVAELAALDERHYIPVEIVPLLFRPRILPLEKWDEELISRVQDFADSFDVCFHAVCCGVFGWGVWSANWRDAIAEQV